MHALYIKQPEMAVTCAGLGDSQAKPSCESRVATASARSGATQQKVQGAEGLMKLALLV